jgi:hypothetical protein
MCTAHARGGARLSYNQALTQQRLPGRVAMFQLRRVYPSTAQSTCQRHAARSQRHRHVLEMYVGVCTYNLLDSGVPDSLTPEGRGAVAYSLHTALSRLAVVLARR